RPDCSTGGRGARGKLRSASVLATGTGANRPSACPRYRSGGVPVDRERCQQAPGQLDLEPDAVGLVGACEAASALVAEANRRPGAVRDAQRRALHAWTQRLVDAGEQQLDPLSC